MSHETLAALANALEACAQALRALDHAPPATPVPTGPTVPTLLTVAQLCRKHPAFKPQTLYGWMAAREANGLAAAVIHPSGPVATDEGSPKAMHGRLLIDETAFFTWLERYREKARTSPPTPVLHFPPARTRRAR